MSSRVMNDSTGGGGGHHRTATYGSIDPNAPTRFITTGGGNDNASVRSVTVSPGQIKHTRLRLWGLTAGFLYVVIIVFGLTAEMGIRGSMINYADYEATAAHIVQNPKRFRWGIIVSWVMSSADIVVALLLGFILVTAGAPPVMSFVSVIFRIMQQAVIATNLLHLLAASLLLDPTLHPALTVTSVMDLYVLPASGVNTTVVDGSTQYTFDGTASATAVLSLKQPLAFFFIMLHSYGYLLALMFFGVSLALLGAIVLRYGIFPKFLGFALFLAGSAYLLDSLCFILVKKYSGEYSSILMIPVFIAEFGLAGWLLAQPPAFAKLE